MNIHVHIPILIILIWLKFIQKFIENYNTKLKMLRFIINKLDNDTIKLIRKKEQFKSKK